MRAVFDARRESLPESEPVVLLSAGGTGGHVFPALALAEELRRRGARVVWTGRAGGLESEVAAAAGFDFEPLAAAGFFGKGVLAKTRALMLLGPGALRAVGLLRRSGAAGVVATGGFATAGVLVAALLAGVPYFLLEQNCVPGRVTRRFAARARESFVAFPTRSPFPGPHSVVGMPLRRGLLEEAGRAVTASDRQTVLVIGGSLGARALNLAVPALVTAVPNRRYVVLTGRRDYRQVRELLSGQLDAATGQRVEVVEFTERPEELYRRAALAVSRAGGVVLAELAAFGIPAVLVPFPHAVDLHQDANAAFFASMGAAEVMQEDADLGQRLAEAVRRLLADEGRRSSMASAMLAAARPDAARVIAGRVLSCLEG